MAVSRRLPGLDLLRGVAILLVLLRHSWPDTFGNAGVVGVVAFFALSGYLITGLLMRDLETGGRVRYGRFYLHRAIRLLPALYVLLAVHALVILLGDPLREGTANAFWGVLVGVTYTANLPGLPVTVALPHLWTLATEEQFYLVWPWVLTLGLRWGRMRTVVTVAVAAVLLGLLGSMILRWQHLDTIYTMPFSWSIALLIGAVARLGADRLTVLTPTSARVRIVAGTLAVAGLVAVSLTPSAKDQPWLYLVASPLVAVCAVVLVFELRRWPTMPRPLVPLVALGTVSYAAYLWNYPVTRWLEGTDGRLGAGAAVGSLVLTLVIATASWFLVETPAQRLRRRVETRLDRRAAAAAAPGAAGVVAH